MEAIRFSLFGKLRIQIGNTAVAGLEARKVQELICYLLVNRREVHHRERLASLFWENQTTANSRKYLRQTLWQLQTVLDQTTGSGDPLLLVDDEWIQLNPAAALWLDVAELENAFRAVQPTPGAQLGLAQAEALMHAVTLYRGDLLDGWFADWCIFERERMQSMYLGALDKLLGYCEARQDYPQALQYGTTILRCDRARERTHRCLMRLHYLAGDRTRALRQYEACLAALHEELGVTPARSTQVLYEQIRADELDAGHVTATAHPTSPALHEVLQTLHHLNDGIKALSAQLESCLHAVERSARGPENGD
jgi:DNA-binding SARP family transcriptional activator